MSVHLIRMPDIGEGIAEVEVVAWHVKPGDSVREDQVLAEVMTDKATVEIPSPVTGRVVSLHGEVGQVMAVGADLIRLATEAGADAEASPAGLPNAASPGARQDSGPATRNDGKPAAEVDTLSIRGTAKPLASPSVRRHARELEIELREVQGSGPGGRIVHADLEARAARRTEKSAVAAQGPTHYVPRSDEEKIPVVGLRRRIAQRMQEAKRRIPHFTYVEEVDVTELEALRARLNTRHGDRHGKLTLLPFLVRALVLGLREFPQANARFDDEAGIVTRHGAVHIGIAAQTEHGLVVPVLRNAEARDLWSSAREIARLAEAARSGRATREELSGSTITITSLGALGGIVTTPVINYPEVAIIGINRIVERPVILGGAVVARKMMNLSSSFDHRVIDGMHAAEFVQALKGLLECPALLFVEPG